MPPNDLDGTRESIGPFWLGMEGDTAVEPTNTLVQSNVAIHQGSLRGPVGYQSIRLDLHKVGGKSSLDQYLLRSPAFPECSAAKRRDVHRHDDCPSMRRIASLSPQRNRGTRDSTFRSTMEDSDTESAQDQRVAYWAFLVFHKRGHRIEHLNILDPANAWSFPLFELGACGKVITCRGDSQKIIPSDRQTAVNG